jgi:transcription initiation factor TFIID subunit TAF12
MTAEAPPYVDSASDERIVNNDVRHQYRVLNDGEKRGMTHLKDMGLGLIRAIEANVPAGREASLAKTKVEEAVMWAVKGLTA